MESITIYSNGIFKLLKPGKTSGPDDIFARFLSEFAYFVTSVTPSLIILFQASLDQQKLPSA